MQLYGLTESGVQDFNWNDAIQHAVWLRRYITNGISHSNFACSQGAKLDGPRVVGEIRGSREIGRDAVMHGMYALKQRQKKFHDSHISMKEFKLGDLVLLFTLKQFVSKFANRGQ